MAINYDYTVLLYSLKFEGLEFLWILLFLKNYQKFYPQQSVN